LRREKCHKRSKSVDAAEEEKKSQRSADVFLLSSLTSNVFKNRPLERLPALRAPNYRARWCEKRP